ncbi:MAG: hypothetical protein M3Z04_00950 [Chloroflexota bacterium]|nr:hypothetical protein [Chloroflexota bacterium]
MENEISDVRVLLDALRVEIRRGSYTHIDYGSLDEYRAHGWGGAGVIVTKEPPPREASSDWRSVYYAVTPHANEVGWLFRGLWAAFRPLLDHMSKQPFFERLATVIPKYQESRKGKPENAGELLTIVLNEAYNILDDIQKGTFDTLALVFHP